MAYTYKDELQEERSGLQGEVEGPYVLVRILAERNAPLTVQGLVGILRS